MFEVLHPTKNEMISVLDYLKLITDAGDSLTRTAVAARCPVCKHSMKDRAGSTQANAHFYHLNDFFCPTKDPNARPYLGKSPRQIDTLKIAANRKYVAEHLDAIYSRLQEIVPRLDFTEFILMLEEAKRLNAYGYAGLDPEYFPYVLVTLMNFLPSTSYKKLRKFKFIFFYEETIKTYEDLWISRGFCSDLIRISYVNSLTNKVQRIDTSTAYLNSTPAYQLSPKQRTWILKIM